MRSKRLKSWVRGSSLLSCLTPPNITTPSEKAITPSTVRATIAFIIASWTGWEMLSYTKTAGIRPHGVQAPALSLNLHPPGVTITHVKQVYVTTELDDALVKQSFLRGQGIDSLLENERSAFLVLDMPTCAVPFVLTVEDRFADDARYR